jgi:hypothetical protein
MNKEQPIIMPSYDGIYPRCVWCNGENYGPNVIDYSEGKSGCHQCGKLLPKEYIKL